MQFVYESNVTVANRAKTSDNLSYVNDFIGLGLAVSMVRREASNVKENWPTNGKTRSSYLCAMNAFYSSPTTSGHFLVNIRPVLPHRPGPTS